MRNERGRKGKGLEGAFSEGQYRETHPQTPSRTPPRLLQAQSEMNKVELSLFTLVGKCTPGGTAAL